MHPSRLFISLHLERICVHFRILLPPVSHIYKISPSWFVSYLDISRASVSLCHPAPPPQPPVQRFPATLSVLQCRRVTMRSISAVGGLCFLLPWLQQNAPEWPVPSSGSSLWAEPRMCVSLCRSSLTF